MFQTTNQIQTLAFNVSKTDRHTFNHLMVSWIVCLIRNICFICNKGIKMHDLKASKKIVPDRNKF